jgi:Secretion system C-terminal sorting domain
VDEFSFVLLKNITNGTIINFTENAWLSTGVFRTGENTVTWTTTRAYVAGTEIKVVGTTATYAYLLGGSPVIGGSAGTLAGTALSLSANGDQVLAYQGVSTSPTFISAIHMNVYSTTNSDPVTTTEAAWDGTANTGNSSALPTGLASGTNAIWIGTQGDINTEKDNAYFVCSGNLTTVANIKALIYDKTKWTTTDNDPAGFSLPTNCNYLGINASLPIELISFQGKNTDGGNLLTWQTASEKDNLGFHIQRSSDTKNFETIGFVKGFGTTSSKQNYTFIDEKSHSSLVYYRLRQEDYDGKTDFSNIISLQYKGSSKVKIYPTITSGELRIEGANNFAITNTNGQVVFTHYSNSKPSFSISHLSNGMYIIKGLDTEGGHFLQKIVVVQ